MPCTPDTCGSSTPELKATVANFLERAEKIASHHLAGQVPTFSVNFIVDPSTGELAATEYDPQVLPEDDWLPLAARMRPIIFLENDHVSIPRLTARIEREHVLLRDQGKLKQARKDLAAWKRRGFVYKGNLDRVPSPLLPGQVQMQHVKIAAPASPASGPSRERQSTDYEYAVAYFNGSLWHGDADKRIKYDAASEQTKKHFQKCAEIRVMRAAIDIIPPLRQLIMDARADGHDF